MKSFKFMVLGTVAIFGFTAPVAMAAEQYSTPYNIASPGASRSLAIRNYFNYEEREPCQNYRAPPAGFYYDGCDLMKIYSPVMAKVQSTAESVAKVEPAAGNEMAFYKINFSYDKSSIEPTAKETLDQIAYDIKRYNPRKVIVAGYTDTAGSSSYNEKLSQKRADSVSQALHYRGINSQTINRQSYGERNLAVETNDGVKLRENRRAIIQFVK